ncbi:MAG: hypothetical protein WA484_02435 [Solirubrobacteraceae bacterium]
MGALIAIALLGVVVTAARGDADPASDVLLTQNAFYPYQPPVPPKLEAALNALLASASHKHMPLKVAIVGSREDLGAIPTFFGYPQKYAEFLDREISYNSPQPLLVVMPAGFGLVAAGPASVLAHLTINPRPGTYGLTRTAILAVTALARANGHAIASRSIPPVTPAAHRELPTAVLFSLPVMLLIAAGIAIRRSGKRRDPPRRTSSGPPPA